MNKTFQKIILYIVLLLSTSCGFDEMTRGNTIGVKHHLRATFLWKPRALEFFPRYFEVQNLEYAIDDKIFPEFPPFSENMLLGFYSVNESDSLSISIGLPYSPSECQQNEINSYFLGIELKPDSLSAVLLLNHSTSQRDSVLLARFIQLRIKPVWSTTSPSDFNFGLVFLDSLDSIYTKFNSSLSKLTYLKQEDEFTEWRTKHESTIENLVSTVNQFAFYISASKKSSKRIARLQLDMNKNYENILIALSNIENIKTDTPFAILLQKLFNNVLTLQNTINGMRNEWIELLVVDLDLVYNFETDYVPFRPVPWIFHFPFLFSFRLPCE